jgi:hypothetical protein
VWGQEKQFVSPSIGQTSDEVRALMGPPEGVDPLGRHAGHFDWFYYVPGQHQKVKVAFRGDRVVNLKTLDTQKEEQLVAKINSDYLKGPAAPKEPNKFVRGLAVALDVAGTVFLAGECYDVGRKPVLLMTVNDWAMARSCREIGFLP